MTSGHLVHECGEAISAALDKAEAVELLCLAPAEKAAALVELVSSRGSPRPGCG